ncbi:hypothetical protein D3C83_73320 [compost metagenome]
MNARTGWLNPSGRLKSRWAATTLAAMLTSGNTGVPNPMINIPSKLSRARPPANPSMPSMRLKAFTNVTTNNTVNGNANGPRFT